MHYSLGTCTGWNGTGTRTDNSGTNNAAQNRTNSSLKPRLVLPFQDRLSEIVLENRPLNGSSNSSSSILEKAACNWYREPLPSAVQRRHFSCSQQPTAPKKHLAHRYQMPAMSHRDLQSQGHFRIPLTTLILSLNNCWTEENKKVYFNSL